MMLEAKISSREGEKVSWICIRWIWHSSDDVLTVSSNLMVKSSCLQLLPALKLESFGHREVIRERERRLAKIVDDRGRSGERASPAVFYHVYLYWILWMKVWIERHVIQERVFLESYGRLRGVCWFGLRSEKIRMWGFLSVSRWRGWIRSRL